jgi:hypothetical protein
MPRLLQRKAGTQQAAAEKASAEKAAADAKVLILADLPTSY